MKAAVALLQIEANGMAIDVQQARQVRQAMQAQLRDALNYLMGHSVYRTIFRLKKDKDGKEVPEADSENPHKPRYSPSPSLPPPPPTPSLGESCFACFSYPLYIFPFHLSVRLQYHPREALCRVGGGGGDDTARTQHPRLHSTHRGRSVPSSLSCHDCCYHALNFCLSRSIAVQVLRCPPLGSTGRSMRVVIRL